MRLRRSFNDCRKSGYLPLRICAEDGSRACDHLEKIDKSSVEDRAQQVLDYVDLAHQYYTPFSFFRDLDVYVEVGVEKIDLKSLYAKVCQPFTIPLTNIRGWADINSRAGMARRFKHWESQGKQCVLLYCGDFDPGGLNISGTLRKNFWDLYDAEDDDGPINWNPDNLIIDRFGLNKDFIDEMGLTWIDNLETSSGGRLNDPKHRDHKLPYVQNYIKKYGVRKVEANALVVRPEEGRELCRQAILRYIPEDSPADYWQSLSAVRYQVRDEIRELLIRRAA
jgi:hypothetical protein